LPVATGSFFAFKVLLDTPFGLEPGNVSPFVGSDEVVVDPESQPVARTAASIGDSKRAALIMGFSCKDAEGTAPGQETVERWSAAAPQRPVVVWVVEERAINTDPS